MGIREKLSSGNLGLVGAAVLIIVAVAYGWHFFAPSSGQFDPSREFYSIDDGTSFYKDSAYKFPPYDDGQSTVVGARVYEDTDGHQFVGFLWRYTPESKKQLEDAYQNGPAGVDALLSNPTTKANTEVKLPGSGNKWLPGGAARGFNIQAPGGGLALPVRP